VQTAFSKIVILVLLLTGFSSLSLLDTARAQPAGVSLAQIARDAESGAISLDELASKLIKLAEESPDFESQIERVEIWLPGFEEVLRVQLEARLTSLLNSRVKLRTDGLKALVRKVFTEDSQYYLTLLRFCTVIDNSDVVRSFLVGGVPELSRPEVQAQFGQYLNLGLKTGLEKGLWKQAPIEYLRRIIDYDAFWATGATTEYASRLLAELSRAVEKDDFSAASWPLEADYVQNYLQELAASKVEAKEALLALYRWRVVELVKKNNGPAARLQFGRILTLRPDANTENDMLRLAVLQQAQGESSRQFAVDQLRELQRRRVLGVWDKIGLGFRGYLGSAVKWALLGVVILFVLFFFCAGGFVVYMMLPEDRDGGKEKKKKRRKRGPGYAQDVDSDDEYTQLLARFGLDDRATESQIKKAFRTAAKKHHPDAHGASGVARDEQGNRDDTFEDLHKAYDRIMEIRSGWFGGKK